MIPLRVRLSGGTHCLDLGYCTAQLAVGEATKGVSVDG